MTNQAIIEGMVYTIASSIVLHVKDGWNFDEAVEVQRKATIASDKVFQMAVNQAKESLSMPV